jgi:alpha-glucosidase (family GH31 glycosyl hydrolase)
MNLESDAKAHGVFLLNSNAMGKKTLYSIHSVFHSKFIIHLDVDVSPMPSVTFHTIGGILDFFVFLGPSPDEVISQYTQVIGKPFLPPYWSLGFHLCRYGYSDTADVHKIIQRNRAIGMPYVSWSLTRSSRAC